MRRNIARGPVGGLTNNLFTWLGLLIVALGWVLLIADILVSDAMLRTGNLVVALSMRADIMTVAQTAIVSGFGLAIIGALRSGFGAFSRFFDAVLQRATPRSPALDQGQGSMVAPVVAAPMATAPAVVVPTERTPPPQPPPPLRTRERNYVIRADGSVEVETMFGTRIFATLDEAHEFIR